MNEDPTKEFLRDLDYRLMLRGAPSIYAVKQAGTASTSDERRLTKWLTEQVVKQWTPMRRRRAV